VSHFAEIIPEFALKIGRYHREVASPGAMDKILELMNPN
jgi:hypothetical protein